MEDARVLDSVASDGNVGLSVAGDASAATAHGAVHHEGCEKAKKRSRRAIRAKTRPKSTFKSTSDRISKSGKTKARHSTGKKENDRNKDNDEPDVPSMSVRPQAEGATAKKQSGRCNGETAAEVDRSLTGHDGRYGRGAPDEDTGDDPRSSRRRRHREHRTVDRLKKTKKRRDSNVTGSAKRQTRKDGRRRTTSKGTGTRDRLDSGKLEVIQEEEAGARSMTGLPDGVYGERSSENASSRMDDNGRHGKASSKVTETKAASERRPFRKAASGTVANSNQDSTRKTHGSAGSSDKKKKTATGLDGRSARKRQQIHAKEPADRRESAAALPMKVRPVGEGTDKPRSKPKLRSYKSPTSVAARLSKDGMHRTSSDLATEVPGTVRFACTADADSMIKRSSRAASPVATTATPALTQEKSVRTGSGSGSGCVSEHAIASRTTDNDDDDIEQRTVRLSSLVPVSDAADEKSDAGPGGVTHAWEKGRGRTKKEPRLWLGPLSSILKRNGTARSSVRSLPSVEGRRSTDGRGGVEWYVRSRSSLPVGDGPDAGVMQMTFYDTYPDTYYDARLSSGSPENGK